jgi:Ca2+-transporting ATPase
MVAEVRALPAPALPAVRAVAAPAAEVLHATPGRTRLQVEGLREAPALAHFLERELAQQGGVRAASASVWTGNVVVHHAPTLTAAAVAALVRAAVRAQARAATVQERDATPFVELVAQLMAGRDRARAVLAETTGAAAPPWHILGTTDVQALFESDRRTGLTTEAAQERQRLLGENRLPDGPARTRWDILAGQFTSLPVALLAGAAGLSLLTGGVLDAAVILGVVVANGFIGYATERGAEREIESLRRGGPTVARVVRDGIEGDVRVEHVVPGDVLVLKPGTSIAADARVVAATNLSIDESALTGESMPVAKRRRRLEDARTPLADRGNMVWRGTTVTGGEGRAVVVGTGRHTELGRIQLLLSETLSPETPIERQLGQIGDHLVLVAMGICGGVFGVGLLRGYAFLEMARMGIALAASAVPEGLPAAATTTLALGVRRMRARDVLVRTLDAVETLGAVETVCFDKTGTVTENRMQAERVFVSGTRFAVRDGEFVARRADGSEKHRTADEWKELRNLTRISVLCSETRIGRTPAGGRGLSAGNLLQGSATENALVALALSTGVDAKAVRREYPLLTVTRRSENRLFMSTCHRAPRGEGLFAVKGSPEAVLALCSTQLRGGVEVPLEDADRAAILSENDLMAREALRVLGFAFRFTPEPGADPLDGGAAPLTWVGLVGMADPIRPGIEETIRAFHRAGIETALLTGDQRTTAEAVARTIGLDPSGRYAVLDAVDLEALDDAALAEAVRGVRVFARVTPGDKLRIVRALQAQCRVVAMTGDGINDGPALKAADVGIAMGAGGTDVAREVGDIVLERDDLGTLVTAVGEGRTTFANIRKSVHFFLATNLSEIIVMGSAVALGAGMPLNTRQLLWINLISDVFPAFALSLEEAEPDVLDQQPRGAAAPLFTGRDYGRMARESVVLSAGALTTYAWGALRYGLGAQSSSLAFQALTTAQLLHAYHCRSERHGLFSGRLQRRNRALDLAIGGSLLLQLLTVLVPGLRSFLGLAPMGLLDAAVVVGTSAATLLANDALKSR